MNRINPIAKVFFNLLNQNARSTIDLIAYAVCFRHLRRDQILLACMPKSGSSYLTNIIGRLDNFSVASLSNSFGRVEQELAPSKALKRARRHFIAQQHTKYNEASAFIIDHFDILPVVQVRNIFDCVISLRDHLRREPVEIPMAFFEHYHPTLDDNELEDMIVRLAVPWYVHFYASWTKCPQALWVTYDEVISDPADVVRRILIRSGRPDTPRELDRAIAISDPAADRKNIGKSGRGENLSDENKALIRRFCSFYPNIDFSLIGINQN